jgi:phosphoribosyl-AMP cyclohydrolase
MVENIGELPELKLNYGKLYDAEGVGLVPAIILNCKTNRLLMVGFMNPEAYRKSRETRLATFWSRDRRNIRQLPENTKVGT